MAQLTSPQPHHYTTPRHPLTAQQALTRAWLLWTLLLPIPFVPFLYALYHIMNGGMDSSRSAHARHWLLYVIAYAIVTIPAALYVRSRCFRAYWQRQPVSPADYLRGCAAIWLAIISAATLAAFACLHTHTLVPNALPGAVLLFLYFTLIPTGTALHPHPEQEDPAQYDEPR